MGNVFNIKIDVQKLEAEFRDMNNALKKATVNSLNTVGRKINKEMALDIKQHFNIKARSLKLGKIVRLIRADARKQIPFFTISILKKARGLALYSPRRTKAGIEVEVKKGRRKIVKSSFFITSRKKGKKFVARKGKEGRAVERISRTGKRYKAARSEFLLGPSIAQLYRRRKSLRLIDMVIDRDYKKTLDENFNKQFEKRR